MSVDEGDGDDDDNNDDNNFYKNGDADYIDEVDRVHVCQEILWRLFSFVTNMCLVKNNSDIRVAAPSI